MCSEVLKLALIWTLFVLLFTLMQHHQHQRYSTSELLDIKCKILQQQKEVYVEQFKDIIPSEMKRRKRGKRAGIRIQIKKRKCRIPMPTFNFGNIRSLRAENKIDQINCYVKYYQSYKNICILALSESWLVHSDPSESYTIEGYSLYRCDRDKTITSVPMKCLERLVLKHLKQHTENSLDPYQFAYRSKRGTEDALLTYQDLILQHISQPKCYARVLMIDFSSAFNICQDNEDK